MQVLCFVSAQGGGHCSIIHMVKMAVQSAKGCCTATAMALTSIEQKLSPDINQSVECMNTIDLSNISQIN